MRPTVETSRDPLRPENLPPIDRLEFDYRCEQLSDQESRQLALNRLLFFSSVGLLLTLGTHLAWLFAEAVGTYTQFAYAVAYGFALLLVWGTVIRFLPRTPGRILCDLLVGPPIAWLIFATMRPGTGPITYLVLYTASFLLALFIARRVIQHFSLWMHANPYLPRTARSTWYRAWYGRPWKNDDDNTPLQDHKVYEQELAEKHHSQQHWHAAILAFLLGLAVYFLIPNHVQVFAGFIAVALTISFMVGYGLYSSRSQQTQDQNASPVRLAAKALASWLTYNEHDTKAPGLFQSSSGPYIARFLMLAGCVLALSLSLLPLTSYFPLGMLLSGPSPWQEAMNAPSLLEAEDAPEEFPPPPPTPEQRRDVISKMTRQQQTYYKNLPTHYRDEYITLLVNRQTPASTDSATEPPDLYTRVKDHPQTWLKIAIQGSQSGRPAFLLALLLSACLSVLVPPLFLFAVLLCTGARTIAHHHSRLEANPDYAKTHETIWAARVSRLRESRHALADPDGHDLCESRHVYVGSNAEFDYPVLIDPRILQEHAHILGDSGSGKTSLGIAPLARQLMALPNTSVVILDLKGDMTLFEAIREEANHQHLPLRWFTSETQNPTFIFNPFLQQHMQDLETHEKAEVLVQSLGLDYGPGYGREHFVKLTRAVFARLLQDGDIRSFKQMQRRLPQLPGLVQDLGLTKRQLDDADEAVTSINLLASIRALNVTADTPGVPLAAFNQRIDMASVVNQPKVIYFYLPASLHSASVREIGNLALFSLLTAARRRRHSENAPDHHVYVFIDEFQQLVSQSLEVVLAQARSLGLGVILCNQTISQLKTPSVDLVPVVQANTRFKQFFSASDLAEQEALIKASGETIYHMADWHGTAQWLHAGLSIDDLFDEKEVHVSEKRGERLLRNDIIQTSDLAGHSIVQITRGDGYTQFGGFPFPLRSEHHVSLNTYKMRARKELTGEWTGQRSGTINASTLSATTDSAPSKPRVTTAVVGREKTNSATPPSTIKETSNRDNA